MQLHVMLVELHYKQWFAYRWFISIAPVMLHSQRSRHLDEPNFSVVFIDKVWQVDRILQERPIAIVLAVSRKGRRRIVKIVECSISQG